MRIFHNDFLSRFFSQILKLFQHFFSSFEIKFSVKKFIFFNTFCNFSFPHRSASQKQDISINYFTFFQIMSISCRNYDFIQFFPKFVKIFVHFPDYIVIFNFLASFFYSVSIICNRLNFNVVIKFCFFFNIIFFSST